MSLRLSYPTQENFATILMETEEFWGDSKRNFKVTLFVTKIFWNHSIWDTETLRWLCPRYMNFEHTMVSASYDLEKKKKILCHILPYCALHQAFYLIVSWVDRGDSPSHSTFLTYSTLPLVGEPIFEQASLSPRTQRKCSRNEKYIMLNVEQRESKWFIGSTGWPSPRRDY